MNHSCIAYGGVLLQDAHVGLCMGVGWVVSPPRMPVANKGLGQDLQCSKCNVILVVTIILGAGWRSKVAALIFA